MRRFVFVLTTAWLAAMTPGAQAGGLESFVGQKPARLLKTEKPFAKAYQGALAGQDLPAWTSKLTTGFPAEAIELDGRTLILVSACSPKGCEDERLYALYEPADQSITGLLFLPDADGESRMAFSRWFGKTPNQPRSQFLLERATDDAQAPRAIPNH